MTGTLNDGREGKGVCYAARPRRARPGRLGEIADANHWYRKGRRSDSAFRRGDGLPGFAGRQLSDPVAATFVDLDKASEESVDRLRATQKADHEKWFVRVSMNLNDGLVSANAAFPMAQRLAGFAKGAADPELTALVFQLRALSAH